VLVTSIVLVLPSPLEDPLSAKRVPPTRRRVQAFVLLAIAVFVAGGIAVNRYVTAAHIAPPDTTPASDARVGSTPEKAAVKPGAPSAQSAPTAAVPTLVPKAAPHRAKPRTSGKAKAGAAPVSTKGLSAEDAAVRLTNAQRTQHGCAPLRSDSRLRTAARRHSADMEARNYFDHNSPDGRTPWDRIKAAGYSTPGAENIAKGYATAQAVVQGWMNSPGHRANILNCSLKAVGIGVEYGQGGPWWTQDFGFK
jgi:uncharacterized protein YkwD